MAGDIFLSPDEASNPAANLQLPATTRTQERRQFLRIALRGKLLVRHNDEEYLLTTVDFGFGGVFLQTATPFPIDTMLTIGLEHDGFYAESSGRVMRHDEYGMAIAFVEPSVAFSTLLIAVIEPHLLSSIDVEEAAC